jgi:hypothetical protein
MSKFPDWFKRTYKQWRRSQPGEEDFLAFCAWVGYPPYIILSWLDGDSTPEGADVLNLAVIFSKRVYGVLELKPPDEDIFLIAKTFSATSGDQRLRLIHILWQAGQELHEKGLSPSSKEGAELILAKFQQARAG